jgi:ferredoxin
MFKVRVSETNETFSCDSEHSVLEGMVRLGRRGISVGCRGGGCGVCKVEVVSGGFEHKAMSRSHISEEDQCQGRVLACRIMPTSDIELRVIGGVKRVLACQGAGKDL